jgi:hypothetical protein
LIIHKLLFYRAVINQHGCIINFINTISGGHFQAYIAQNSRQ